MSTSPPPILVYLAHPVGAPDASGVEANLGQFRRWLHYLVELPDERSRRISWCAPWYAYAATFDDNLLPIRRRAMRDTTAVLERCDAVLAIGKLTPGMKDELAVSQALHKPQGTLIHLGPWPPPQAKPNWWTLEPHRQVISALHQIVAAVDQLRAMPRPAA